MINGVHCGELETWYISYYHVAEAPIGETFLFPFCMRVKEGNKVRVWKPGKKRFFDLVVVTCYSNLYDWVVEVRKINESQTIKKGENE